MTYEKFANQIRRETLRCINSQGSGHIGGSLSIIDALTTLYFNVMNVDPADMEGQLCYMFPLI